MTKTVKDHVKARMTQHDYENGIEAEQIFHGCNVLIEEKTNEARRLLRRHGEYLIDVSNGDEPLNAQVHNGEHASAFYKLLRDIEHMRKLQRNALRTIESEWWQYVKIHYPSRQGEGSE